MTSQDSSNIDFNDIRSKLPKRIRATAPSNLNVFTEASKYTNSSFWQIQLTNAGQGIFPLNFGFDNGLLLYVDDRNDNHYIPISSEPDHACEQFISFLKERGYDSPEGKSSSRYFDRVDNGIRNSWTGGCRRIYKNKMMESFIIDSAKKYNLTQKETKKLRLLIKEGLIIKSITKDNIVVSNLKVVEIKGLTFDPETRQFNLSSEYQQKIKIPEVKNTNNQFKLTYSQEWLNYIKKYTDIKNVHIEPSYESSNTYNSECSES